MKIYGELHPGTAQRDFRSTFFSSFEPTWATDHLSELLEYKVWQMSPWGVVLGEFYFYSSGYQTPGSQIFNLKNGENSANSSPKLKMFYSVKFKFKFQDS